MKVNTWLPVFPGFYSTIFNGDDIIEREIEYYNEDNGTDLNYDDFDFDYQSYENEVAKYCCDFIEREMADYIRSIKFECVSSPNEYNFRNDAIHCTIVPKKKAILEYLKENEDDFAQWIKDHYTSYSGFISFYSNDHKQWMNFESMNDGHKLGQILNFIAFNNDCDADESMYYYVSEYVQTMDFKVMADAK